MKKLRQTTTTTKRSSAFTGRLNGLSGHRKHVIAIIAVFALLGIIGLQASQAASFVVSSEAEAGTVGGNAVKTADANASGGQAVKFAAATVPVAAPYKAQALTGGDSIAIVWAASNGRIKQYEVYRNDSRIGVVTPGSGIIATDILGRTYIDKNVTRGTSYNYKVRAIDNNGNASPFTTAGTVTHPRSTTPIPAITFDTSQGGGDLLNYLQTQVKPHLETWYPKISDAIAYPDYTPSNTIRISLSLTSGVANAPWGQGLINVNPSWLRANQADGGGMFLHEATHVIQTYLKGDPSAWSTEGIADWTRDWFTMERFHIPGPGGQLSQHYSESGTMLQWAQLKYSPSLIRKVNIAINKGTYTNGFFTNLTGGRTAEQLYAEVKQQYYGSTGPVSGLAGKCMDTLNSSPTVGTKLQLFDCNNSSAQKWTPVYRDAGLHGTAKKYFDLINFAIASDGRCLDVQSSGTASGTIVHSWACNRGDAQQWTRGANNSLVNPNSGKCLATTGGTSENGNQLIINNCDGSVSQRWTVPQ